MEQLVTLKQILDAREARAMAQQQLQKKFSKPVLSVTLNIPGPVKNSTLIRRGFQECLQQVKHRFTMEGFPVVWGKEIDQPTGCEALWVVDGPGKGIKELCISLEEEHPLGRLWDLDVLDPVAGKLEREQLGHGTRPCLICGAPGKGCASRRLHSVEQLQQTAFEMLHSFFAQKDGVWLANQAVRALLYEVCTTPKPGLVDCANSGSHRDMDLFTFLDSAATLIPYFQKAVSIGQNTARQNPQETFRQLRLAGLEAEQAMFQVTNGVNTHKGAIFSLGCLCGAMGRLWTSAGPCQDISKILETCSQLSKTAVDADLEGITSETAVTSGQRLYAVYGLRGVRGEVADGFPSLQVIGLPVLQEKLAQGYSLPEAGRAALIHLMAQVTDTNVVSRGGIEGQQWVKQQATELCQHGQETDKEILEELDRAMIAQNLSPGGCADLMAILYFLMFCKEYPKKN